MTELEIINDAESCVRGECDRCSQEKADYCERTLLKKAIGLLKLQRTENDTIRQRLKKMEQEASNFKFLKKCNFSKEVLFDKVNALVFLANEFDPRYSDEDKNPYDLIYVMNKILLIADVEREYCLSIDRSSLLPKIVKRGENSEKDKG